MSTAAIFPPFPGRRSPARLLLAGLLTLGALGTTHALDWQSRTLAFTTAPFQTTQEATFSFKNTGDRPVTILEVETSCGCVEAAADRQTYAPGATGLLVARMAVGERLGRYERYVYVRTDEGGEPVRLQVQLEVPEIATVSPRAVAWRLHEAATEQAMVLTAGPGLEIIFDRAETTSEDFTVRLETVTAGHAYRVVLAPRSTAQTANTAVRLYGHESHGHDVLVSAYGNVQ